MRRHWSLTRGLISRGVGLASLTVLVLCCARFGLAAPLGQRSSGGALYEQTQQEQQQNQGLQPDTGIQPQEVPSPSIPTVILDDTRTVSPQQQQNGAKIVEPNQPLQSSPKPRTRTVQLTDFQQLVATSLGQTLPIYGANLFEDTPTTFAPVDHAPVTAEYMVGPGR